MSQKLHRCELKIDVTGSVDLSGKLEIAATVVLPDPASLGELPIALFTLPGGGYSRNYYDMHIDGHEGYSQAEYHAARGVITVAIDHLGVGESTLAGLDSMHIEDLARANDTAVREIIQRLKSGTLTSDFPALPTLFAIGIGQSMGGGVTFVMQGRHSTYQAIAILGYSAIHTVMPQPTEEGAVKGRQGYGRDSTRDTDPKSLSLVESLRSTVDFIYPFHWEDVPADIIAADMDGGFPVRKHLPKWASATLPNLAAAMMAPGFVADDVAVIDVPVLVGVGERDTVPDPFKEPAVFRRTTDVSVYIVPKMAHMHNFASTRELLWRRIHDWSRMVAHASLSR